MAAGPVDWQFAQQQDPDRAYVIYLKLVNGAEVWFRGVMRLGFGVYHDSAGAVAERYKKGYWIVGEPIAADRSRIPGRTKVSRFFSPGQFVTLKIYWE